MKSQSDYRNEVRKKTSNVSRLDLDRASEKISLTLNQMICVSKQDIVGSYEALPGEVSVVRWETQMRALGGQIAYPQMVSMTEMCMTIGPEDRRLWKMGAHFKILEPPETAKKVCLSELKCLVVPGVAFGEGGERIGRGGGHYDRLLAARNATLLTIGIALEYQVFPLLPRQPWDVLMDWIVTEKRVLKIGKDR